MKWHSDINLNFSVLLEDPPVGAACQDIHLHSKMYTNQMFILLLIVDGGLIGNGLVFLVLFSKKKAKQPSNIFIISVAISDSTFLVMTLVETILWEMKCMYFRNRSLDIVHHSNIICKFLAVIFVVIPSYSSMLILCFTIEKVIVVYKPLKVKQICTTKSVKCHHTSGNN